MGKQSPYKNKRGKNMSEIVKFFEENGISKYEFDEDDLVWELSHGKANYCSEFELISSNMDSYDEGILTTENIIRHVKTGRCFRWFSYDNSWADYSESTKLKDVQEVYPHEKTITIYTDKK